MRANEKWLVKSNFSFSHNDFYPFGEHTAIFITFEIVVCKLFEFGKSLKLVIWERDSHHPLKEIGLGVAEYLKTEQKNALILLTKLSEISSGLSISRANLKVTAFLFGSSSRHSTSWSFSS